jgi:hypothetical protein
MKPLPRGRAFVRALIATRYVLGTRGNALSAGLERLGPAERPAVDEIMAQLAHGVREQRARVLAAEAGRMLRALNGEKIR